GASGAYSFTGLGTSTYRVRLVRQSGWTQTTADPDITPSSGVDVAGVDFGSFQQITVSGALFQDGNGDGVRQAGEGGLSGREVRLLDAGDNVLATATTDAGGAYAFAGLGPGTYRVRQVLPAGWMQTTADPVDVTAASGTDVAGVNFGAFQQ